MNLQNRTVMGSPPLLPTLLYDRKVHREQVPLSHCAHRRVIPSPRVWVWYLARKLVRDQNVCEKYHAASGKRRSLASLPRPLLPCGLPRGRDSSPPSSLALFFARLSPSRELSAASTGRGREGGAFASMSNIVPSTLLSSRTRFLDERRTSSCTLGLAKGRYFF